MTNSSANFCGSLRYLEKEHPWDVVRCMIKMIWVCPEMRG